MNPNPHAVRILCFGDSNTWGQRPDKTGRFPSDVRWTGRLQGLLGEDYEILEEGLGGRTTNVDYANRLGKNGLTYLGPCLASQGPLDVIILMLGTNDLKIEFQRSAEDIAQSLSGLIACIKEQADISKQKIPAILLVSPAAIDSTAPHFKTFYEGVFDKNSVRESKRLGASIGHLAQEEGCAFFDAMVVATVGEDGLHLTPEAHQRLAESLRTLVMYSFEKR